MTNDSEFDDSELDGYDALMRLQQRTWAAAVPYFAAAVVAWVGAGLAEYQVTGVVFAISDDSGHSALRQTFFQVLSQVLLFIGVSLFLVGVLVAAFRQHERWRRDCSRWLDDLADAEVEDGDIEA